jgi:hypothetical protein
MIIHPSHINVQYLIYFHLKFILFELDLIVTFRMILLENKNEIPDYSKTIKSFP